MQSSTPGNGISEAVEQKSASMALGLSVLLCAMLFYLVSVFSLSFTLSRSASDDAISLNTRNVGAWINQITGETRGIALEILKKQNADGARDKREPDLKKGVISAGVQKELQTLIRQLQTALASDPLNAPGLRLLALLYLLNDHPAKSRELQAKASDLSTHEVLAHDFMFRVLLDEKQFASALSYGNRLFSADPGMLGRVSDFFGPLLNDDRARRRLTDMLAERPSWRPAFFSLIVPKLNLTELRGAEALLEDLRFKEGQASSAELNALLNSFVRQKRVDLAYGIWLHFLPPSRVDEVDLINNGQFDGEPSGAPFDWSLSPGKQAKARIGAIPGEKANRGLNIEFGQGRVVLPPVYQYLVLSPGRYRFHGLVMGEVAGRRGLQWIVICLEGKRSGESDMILGRIRRWQKIEFEFQIAERECSTQRLELIHSARSPSEQIVTGSAWFDQLVVERLDEGAK